MPAMVNIKGLQPLGPNPLPRRIMLGQMDPWLGMEHTVAALLEDG